MSNYGEINTFLENEADGIMYEKIECKICHQKFKQITYTHLLRKHKTSFAEYRKLFPGAKLIPDKVKSDYTILSHSQEKRRHNKEVSMGDLEKRGVFFSGNSSKL